MIVLLSLAVLTAWGTIVEAKYDATIAGKLVYGSIWMYAVMATLAINLTAVMLDRWPWKKRHTSFVLAHIGILVLLWGAVMTKYFGVDGTLTMGMGEKGRHVVIDKTDLTVYTSMDAQSYTKLYDREVDFFLDSPKDRPVDIGLPEGKIRIVDYIPFSLRDEKTVESKDERSGAGIRFQLQNARISLTEWLLQPGKGRDAVKDLGPAQVVLTSGKFEAKGLQKNTIVLRPKSDDGAMEYEIHSLKSAGKPKVGTAKPGDTIETGWMGLVLRVLKFMPRAKQEISYVAVEKPSPATVPALKVEYRGEAQWMALNSILKLFSDQAVYVVAFANRRLDLGFELALKQFNVGRYQGTMRAASYESVVTVPELGDVKISMNEPLKHGGYTFYQASFEQDEAGRPTASVLSVNRDPGRWFKYLGSLLIVLGSTLLFYDKSKRRNPGKSSDNTSAPRGASSAEAS